MSLFKGIGKVEVKRSAEYFPEGTFTVEVNRVKEHTKQTGQRYFIVEFNVLESTAPELPAGSAAQFMETFKYMEKGLARVKQFILAASGADASPDEVTEQVCEAVVGEDQPLAGKKIRVVTRKNKSGKFTEHTFYPAGE